MKMLLYIVSHDSNGWNEDECVDCGEDYNAITIKEDWFMCILAHRAFMKTAPITTISANNLEDSSLV